MTPASGGVLTMTGTMFLLSEGNKGSLVISRFAVLAQISIQEKNVRFSVA